MKIKSKTKSTKRAAYQEGLELRAEVGLFDDFQYPLHEASLDNPLFPECVQLYQQ